eukprot:gene57786-biopygen104772
MSHLLLALLATSLAQTQQPGCTESFARCSGDPLCVPYSREACQSAASDQSLLWGGGGYPAVGNYGVEGCYVYTREGSDYYNMVFYGIMDDGTDVQNVQELGSVDEGKVRVPGHDYVTVSRRLGDALHGAQTVFAVVQDTARNSLVVRNPSPAAVVIHVIRSDGSVCVPYSREACQSAASDQSLLWGGGGYPAVGNYGVEGCYVYTREGSDYYNMVFYGIMDDGTDVQNVQELGSVDEGKVRVPGHDCATATSGTWHICQVRVTLPPTVAPA